MRLSGIVKMMCALMLTFSMFALLFALLSLSFGAMQIFATLAICMIAIIFVINHYEDK